MKTKALKTFFLACALLSLAVHPYANAKAESAIRDDSVLAIEKFIAKWSRSGGSEAASAQLHTVELFKVLGLPYPDAPRPDSVHNTYMHEKEVSKFSADGRKSQGKIDFYAEGCVIVEYKQGSAPRDKTSEGHRRLGTFVRGTQAEIVGMLKAKIQAEEYANLLPEGKKLPPFILLIDIGHTAHIYSDFTGTGNYMPFPSARDYIVHLEDLRIPEVRERIRTIFTDPLSLDPTRESEKVTHEVADKLAELIGSLKDSGHDPDLAALFVMRAIFCMYAEDSSLLPYGSFTGLLHELKGKPDDFQPVVTNLWQSMKVGGDSSPLGTVLYFNGALFEGAEALPLNTQQISFLHEAAESNWATVELSIFGTLLQQALSSQERSKLGAHYTPMAYVERLVYPTCIEPERALWESTKERAVEHLLLSDLESAISELTAFYQRLSLIRVLDPSCGSGNILAVSMRLLKELESEVVQALRELGLSEHEIQKLGYTIKPAQFRGIEIVPRAADIAELVIWISYYQQHFKIHGRITPAEPILGNERLVECRDAVLDWDGVETHISKDGQTKERYINPRPADSWLDEGYIYYIVGNPPFVGTRRMPELLGEAYTEALRKAYPKLPKGTEYVLFWVYRSLALLQEGKVERVGLITTNSIQRIQGQRILRYYMAHENPISLVMAIPDHPWSTDASGPSVRIAMIVAALGDLPGEIGLLKTSEPDAGNSQESQYTVHFDVVQGKINPNMTIGSDVHSAKPLAANKGVASIGFTLSADGFIIDQEKAKELGLGTREGLERHIRPFRNGKDINDRPRNVMCLDLYGLSIDEVQALYPEVYEYLLENVKPERMNHKNEKLHKYWWLFKENNPDFRKTLAGINRAIVTAITAGERYFTFVDSDVVPSNSLCVFAFDDPYILGVLSSDIHLKWDEATGGRRSSGIVYTKTLAFDAFPFPASSAAQMEVIRMNAESLDLHRQNRMALHQELTLSKMYGTLAKVRVGEELTTREEKIAEQSDITTLLQLHRQLDESVAAAYGWPVDLTAEEVVARLLELNQSRHEEEKSGLIRWLRPESQSQKDVSFDEWHAPCGEHQEHVFLFELAPLANQVPIGQIAFA